MSEFQYRFEGRQQVKRFLAIYKLSRYYELLVDEGFDRISILLDITETDLICLSVKRGHRRVLQRAIATARGIPITTPIIINYENQITNRSYTSNDYYNKISHDYRDALKYYCIRKRWAVSKPITPFDKFVNQLQTDDGSEVITEEIMDLANTRWNELTAAEKERYERQALVANSDYIE